MALIDKIQRNLAATGTEAVGTTDQTGRARQLLAAKSGKAVGAGQLAPQSAIAESAAVDQTRQQLEQLQPQGQLAAAEVGQKVQQLGMQEQSARADLDLRRQQMQQQNSIRKQELLSDLGRQRGTLDFEKDKAKLEQLSHTMRMGDQKYLDKLELEGQRNRLDNDLAFKEALQKAVLGSNKDLLVKSLGNQNVLASSDRDFQKAMASIDLNAALQMAQNEMADAKQAATIGAVGAMGAAGVSAYGSYKSGAFSDEYGQYKDAGGQKSYTGWQDAGSPSAPPGGTK